MIKEGTILKLKGGGLYRVFGFRFEVSEFCGVYQAYVDLQEVRGTQFNPIDVPKKHAVWTVEDCLNSGLLVIWKA